MEGIEKAVQQTVIPDEIEPRIGYKYLWVSGEGEMLSPNYAQPWPPLERCEARGCPEYSWEAHRHQPEDSWSTEAVGSNGPSPPRVELPEGMSWFYVGQPHEAVGEKCSCGIYLVNDPKECRHYRSSEAHSVLVEVAMWGRVVVGDSGMRGQYAYPVAIHADKKNLKLAQKAAALYQVPLVAAGKEVESTDYDPANYSLSASGFSFEKVERGRSKWNWIGAAMILAAAVNLGAAIYFNFPIVGAGSVIWGFCGAMILGRNV